MDGVRQAAIALYDRFTHEGMNHRLSTSDALTEGYDEAAADLPWQRTIAFLSASWPDGDGKKKARQFPAGPLVLVRACA